MSTVDLLQTLGVLLIGVLAGEELVVRWGVQPALRALEDRAHVQARQALVRRLRVVVPSLMAPTVVVAVVVLVTAGGRDGVALRWAGLAALLAFVLFSFLGTVPINIQVNDWDLENPPSDWRSVVRRWERIDTYRSSAATLAFVLFTLAVTTQLG